MSKLKSTSAKTTDGKSSRSHATATWSHTLRETVEAIITAFILAFLFRTFEAEAFVIPTGSMAPTLQGRHKDIECPQCGYWYRTGASEEVNNETGALKPTCPMLDATCPMCRFTLNVNSLDPKNSAENPSYNGDRIVVNKLAYDWSDPQRWDVVVFKYPEDAKTNYIKRLVGLPKERLKIEHGDIYTAPLGSDNFRIERKGTNPKKLQAMLQPVFDNDFTVAKLLEAGFPPRWQPWSAPGQPPAWTATDHSRSFETDGRLPDRVWLRYQHLLPTAAVWNAVQNQQPLPLPRPLLISDFYAYNDGDFPNGCDNLRPPTPMWVGDLAIDCELIVKNTGGAVVLELVKGGVQFRCRLDFASGQAKLAISGLPDFSPVGETSIKGPGTYALSFANIDEQLLLWVNDELIQFNVPTIYDPLNNYKAIETQPIPGSERASDFSPAGIAAEDGATIQVKHLNIRRDIYYLSDEDESNLRDRIRSSVDLDRDQFFMLGDNSPRSKDGRYWNTEQFVKRDLLIGKALFVYWPHSWWPSWAASIRVRGAELKVPFWPNFKRMRLVR